MKVDDISHALQAKEKELSTRITAIESDFKKGRSQDFSEQTTETENDEVLDESHHEAKHELTQVKAALVRISEGQYGFCQQCEEPINPKRLTALPYVNTCINCAE